MPTTTAKEYLKILTDYRSEMEKLDKDVIEGEATREQDKDQDKV